MIRIKRFTCNMLAENCYVVSDETKDCVVIDCGALYEEEKKAITYYIRQEDLSPRHLLCTHGHFDHCIGNELIYSTFHLMPEVHEEDQFLIENMRKQTYDILGVNLPMEIPPVGRYLKSNEVIDFGSHKLQILHTPGHTPGGVVFYCEEEDAAFSGDTLFRMSIGRTDFERGSYQQMMESLKNVMTKLPDKTTVYPGHGPETTIADERRLNPYLHFT